VPPCGGEIERMSLPACPRIRRTHPNPGLKQRDLLRRQLFVLLGGICRSSSWYRTALISRLASGLPGVTTGPDSPPCATAARVSSFSPPLDLPDSVL
jgi:hypothetical protein